jgi:hypothetical protein
MASTTDVALSRSALPVCLGGENSHRLVSLWDIVNVFRAHSLYSMLRQMEILEGRLESASQKDRALTVDEMRDVSSTLDFAAQELKLATFDELSEKAQRHTISLSFPSRNNPQSVATTLQELRLDIDRELQRRKFVVIQADRSDLAEREQLFGDEVYDRFESARFDIRNAGNCLAVEDGTGAVFHLARVAEYGLRALAYDRTVEVPKTPLDLATCGQIIQQLEVVEQKIQGYPRSLGREAQFEFYHNAMMELKTFQECRPGPHDAYSRSLRPRRSPLVLWGTFARL